MTPQDSRIFGLPALNRMVVLLALAGLLVMSSAGVASAQTWTHTDPAGDVLTFSEDGADGVAAPDRRAGDVVRTAIAHGGRNVVVRAAMRAVPRGDWLAYVEIRTPRGAFEVTWVRAFGGREFTLERANGRNVRCAGKTFRIIGNALEIVVPRRCLDRPRTIRAGLGVAVFGQNGASHADDALRTGLDRLTLSPLLRRG